jgi:hypothetical protein
MAVKSLGEPYHAESRRFNFHGLRRLTAWGGAAALSLAMVMQSANSDPGAQQRLAAILALVSDQADSGESANAEPAQPLARPNPESEVRRLAETVQALVADRDRMQARINTLERSLDEAATGSINRDGAAERRKSEAPSRDGEPMSRDAAPPPPPAPTGPSSEKPPADTGVTAPRSALPSAPAPVMAASPPAAPLATPAAPVTNPAAGPTTFAVAVPAPAAPKPPPAAMGPTPNPTGPGSAVPSGWLAVASAMPAGQLTAAAMPLADPAAGQAFASAPPAVESAVAANPATVEPVPTRSEIGVDVGGGATVEALRALWTSVKTSAAPLLVNLRPLVVVREVRPGAVELRLVIGPLANATAAARLCASLAATRRACRPTVFDGQRLAQLPTQ